MTIQDPGRISGKRLVNVLNSLKKGRVTLSIRLLGKDVEGLTIVTGVDDSNSRPTFLIDYPGGEKDIFKDSEGGKVFFEYSGPDNLQYSFRAFILRAEEEDIRFTFPEAIERIQRRKHFRVIPPMGTTMIFGSRGRKYWGSVINVSESGALVSEHIGNFDKILFFQGCVLRDMQILCAEENLKARIRIPKAEIVRLEKKEEKGRFQYAVKFMDVNKREQEALRRFIYGCQREELRKRGRFSDP